MVFFMSIEIRRFKEEDAESVSKTVCRNFLEVNIKDYSNEKMKNLAKIYNKNKIL